MCDSHCSSEIKFAWNNQYVCSSLETMRISTSLCLSGARFPQCVCISGLFVRHHRVYIYSRIYFYIGTSVVLWGFFFPGSERLRL